jgi:methionyl-tRNA formyltransferase
MAKVGLFAYGEMGFTALELISGNYDLGWVVLPPLKNQISTEKLTFNLAKEKGIPITSEVSLDKISKIVLKNKTDLILICSFNKILTKEILSSSKFVNVHLGDLPRQRGRANVNWAIINGENEITISVHEVTPDLDGGNIYAKFSVRILEKEDVGDIYRKINKILENNLIKVLKRVENGYKGKPQKGKPTYYPTRLPVDGLIDFNKTSREIYNFIRAQTKPYPGAFTYYGEKKMIVWSSRIPDIPKNFEGRIPGRVIEIHKDGVEVLTGDSSLIIQNISFEGKDENASEIIKSVKSTLGIDYVALYERLVNES